MKDSIFILGRVRKPLVTDDPVFSGRLGFRNRGRKFRNGKTEQATGSRPVLEEDADQVPESFLWLAKIPI